ncbi:TorF family putative porin [Erythrobacter sp. EC-HK427]|uniref:TorF family putative porin n=1 Tax=Erythrobacter sp. EC-HK427 TaxID=2038396 RepID=UPI00125335D3|nr:TorF family putative porin [Erythrobacter sp. EC-HK427]VVS98420.1 putative exported protein [Erythrobacter sp. EC-HK427]
MLTSVRSLSAVSLFAIAALSAAPAMAQEEDEGIGVEVSANVALVSEYRFRGVNLSGGDLAIQGGVDVSLPAGFYIGTWASSLDEDTVGFGHTELDIYGGWAGEFGNVSTDVGVIYYAYPNAAGGSTDYVEFYGSVGVGLGPFDATVGVAYAPDQDSLGGTDNFYVYGDLGLGVPGTPLTVTGHVGYTDGFLTFTNDGEAIDYSIGAEAAIPGTPVSIGAAFVGVEGDVLVDPNGTFTDDSVVLTLSASF